MLRAKKDRRLLRQSSDESGLKKPQGLLGICLVGMWHVDIFLGVDVIFDRWKSSLLLFLTFLFDVW